MKIKNKYPRIVLFLLVVILIGCDGNITEFGWRLNLLTGTCFLALFYLAYFPFKVDLKLKISLIIHNILSILFVIVCPPLLRLPLLVLSALSYHLILSTKDQDHPEMIVLAFSALFFFLYLMIYQYSSTMWYAIQNISQALSRFGSVIIQNSINSNPTYAGLHISIFFLLCSGSILLFHKSKRYLFLIQSLVYVAVITVIYIILQFYLSKWIMNIYNPLYVHVLHGQIILFILLIPWIFYLFSRVEPHELPIKGMFNKKLWVKIPLYLMFFLSFFMLTFHPLIKTGKRNVLLFDQGYLDWNIPDHSQYGSKKGGMFGMLPIFLEANNYDIKHDTIIHAGNLADASILVIINLSREFREDEKQLIWKFVNDGGALFVLGDHTGFNNFREPINDLLAPFKIALNFDCAIPFVQSWRHAMKYFPHDITSSVSSNFESNIFIGASLSIVPPARPLVSGKFGFSDPGDTTAFRNGYLGDMKYTQGEQLGDQILVAETLYGRGKVLVFGDTSPFQNSALVQSHAFVIKVFEWLSTPLNWWDRHHTLIPLILLILSLFILILMKINVLDGIIISVSVCVALFITNILCLNNDDFEQMKSVHEELAIIDGSHLERFSLSQWEGQGYGGLCYNLMRAGFIPLLRTSGINENLVESKLLVLVAPAKPFAKKDIMILERFVRNGGFILATCGKEEVTGSQNLINNFGLNVEYIPLGRIDPDQNSERLSFTKAWALSCADNTCDVLCEVWGYPTILFKSIGKGGIFLIGDSGFLLNDNLEGMESHNRNNILFVRKMIEDYIK